MGSCNGHELTGNLNSRQRVRIAFAETTLRPCSALPTDTRRFNHLTVLGSDAERNHSIQRKVEPVEKFMFQRCDLDGARLGGRLL